MDVMHPEPQDYTTQVIEGSHAYENMTTLTQPIDTYAMSAQTSQQGDTYSMHSSPSPSPPSGTPSGAGRQRSKSGTNHLTMQQLNKKRQRATPEQLIVLEEAFVINPSPNAKMRELIAERIRMTERSVQIWFQNRRAKVKQMQRKEVGEDGTVFMYGANNGSPGMMDHVKRNALMRSNSLGHGAGYGALSADFKLGLRMGFNGPLTPAASPSSKTVISRLTIETLSIASWHRVACSSMDLVCYFSAMEGRFTYYINNSSTGFKIEYPVGAINQIKLEHMVRTDQTNGNSTPGREDAKHRARIMIELNSAPLFYSETRGAGGWQHCHDFTEGLVASRIMLHILVGPYKELQAQISELAAISPDLASRLMIDEQPQYLSMNEDERTAGTTGDRNRRHSSTGAMAAPPRPASTIPPTPMQFSRQHLTPAPVGVFNGSLGGPRIRQSFQAHRRTRSRSLPTAVNVSDLALAASQHMSMVPGMKFGGDVGQYIPMSHEMMYNPQTPLRIDTSVADSMDYYRQFTPSSNMSSLTPVDYMSSPASQIPTMNALPFYEGNEYQHVGANQYAHSGIYTTDNMDTSAMYAEGVNQPLMNLEHFQPQESYNYTTDPSAMQDTAQYTNVGEWTTAAPQVTVTSQMDVEHKDVEPVVLSNHENNDVMTE